MAIFVILPTCLRQPRDPEGYAHELLYPPSTNMFAPRVCGQREHTEKDLSRKQRYFLSA